MHVPGFRTKERAIEYSARFGRERRPRSTRSNQTRRWRSATSRCRRALLEAIERGTFGEGSVAGEEYLRNMNEAREFTHIVRRIAALLLLEPKLDKNYAANKATCHPWSAV